MHLIIKNMNIEVRLLIVFDITYFIVKYMVEKNCKKKSFFFESDCYFVFIS